MDYDSVGTQQLINVKINGEDRKVLAFFNRNGLFYTLDRTNGTFLSANSYINNLNWTKGLDPKTGLPIEYDPNKSLQTYAAGANRRGGGSITSCPNQHGGMNFWPSAVDPSSGIAYGAGLEDGCMKQEVKAQDPKDVKPGTAFFGGGFSNVGLTKGAVFAYDIATGKQIAKHMFPYPSQSGVLLTPGLAWAAQLDGTFGAYDAKTLDLKWEINVGGDMEGSPMTYLVNGKQYIAVLGGATSTDDYGYPELKARPSANMLYVFSL
jgi:alcohol dehydrogenase (cytochrome c)